MHCTGAQLYGSTIVLKVLHSSTCWEIAAVGTLSYGRLYSTAYERNTCTVPARFNNSIIVIAFLERWKARSDEKFYEGKLHISWYVYPAKTARGTKGTP
jgi:hypothetical protein